VQLTHEDEEDLKITAGLAIGAFIVQTMNQRQHLHLKSSIPITTPPDLKSSIRPALIRVPTSNPQIVGQPEKLELQEYHWNYGEPHQSPADGTEDEVDEKNLESRAVTSWLVAWAEQKGGRPCMG
jgi:hypothetical protein